MSDSFKDLKCEEYSEKCVVVTGDTRKYKDDLKILGGKYNSRLRTDDENQIIPI